MNINDFPIGVYNLILEKASTPTQSPHTTFRQLSKKSKINTDKALKLSWGQLREFWKTIPDYHVLKSCFAKVDTHNDYLSLFKSLTKETGIAGHTLFSCSEYQVWMHEQDIALCTIWDNVREKLKPSLQENTLPAVIASPEEIRKFLKEEKTITALETIEELGLSDLQLKVLPSEICLLKNITLLDLDYNQLNQLTIPKEWVALSTLDLRNNQLTQFIIPKECVALTVVYLYNNQLTQLTIPKECVALTEVYLYNNQLTQFTIPKECVALTDVNLTNNQLTQFTIPKECVALTDVNLTNNQLTQFTIPKECVALTDVNLTNNQLTQFTIPKECVALKRLHLSNTPLLISSNTFQKEISVIELFKSKKYQPNSHLGEIYNKIASFETASKLLKASSIEFSTLFRSLKGADKNRIYELIWEGAGSPMGDFQWGEHHCFDDIILFGCAVQRSIFDKYKALNEDDKWKVEGEIYRLVASIGPKASEEMKKDPFWGKHHALDDYAVLADALFALEEGKL